MYVHQAKEKSEETFLFFPFLNFYFLCFFLYENFMLCVALLTAAAAAAATASRKQNFLPTTLRICWAPPCSLAAASASASGTVPAPATNWRL